jgi:thiopeptide-type bacteriocin biosynthesis protein
MKPKKDQKKTNRFAPSGFFVLRAPLLPFDELLAWGEGLEAPLAPENMGAIDRDRQRLRERLAAVFSRPAMREALFIAAPDLEELLDLWLRDPQHKRVERVESALTRYFQRMAGRATPFGLFAGCALGRIADETRLEIDETEACRRHTRLDMDYLFALAEKLRGEESLKVSARYFPNSSLYSAAGRVRYIESRWDGNSRSYHLVAAEESEPLLDTLLRAREGATPRELIQALAEDGFDPAEASFFVYELIDSQLLAPDLELPATGAEPIQPLIDRLRGFEATASVAEHLARAHDALNAIDASGLGVDPGRYRALAKSLEALPAKVELSRLFQVDLVKAAPAATLGGEVMTEMYRGVETLHRLFGRSRGNELNRFLDAFAARYESREVPLVEALDEEIGIGFPPGGGASDEATPLLKGMYFPGAPSEMAYWNARDAMMLGKLTRALERQEFEIRLEASDLDALDESRVPALPNAFSVMGSLGAADEAALQAGDFRLMIRAVTGPSGAPLLGRFCHSDPELQTLVESHLREEEAMQPDALFAEIVHMPEGRVGNILLRPVLREYEIAYLGRSGAEQDRQISITDLLVSVHEGRIRLRSKRLGREIVPRLTNAHAFTNSTSGVYRFLASLQYQDVTAGLGWEWGVLAVAPFLPRVVMGRLVLSLSQWRVSKSEIERLTGAQGAAARFQAVQHWRQERKLPRWIALAEGDQFMTINLDNCVSIETFLHLLKQSGEAVLSEVFPGPDELCARGPEGRFVHELIVPFINHGGHREHGEKTSFATSPSRPWVNRPKEIDSESQTIHRRFAPGSEWIYTKLFTGTTVADQVLRETIRPLVRELQEAGVIDNWFFIRYSDPDWHLRIRIQGRPDKLHGTALPALHEAIAPLLQDGRVWRMQFDTYDRELERYGGAEGIELAERLFHIDSEAVLEILDLLEPGDAGLDERWRLALGGMDGWLDAFGFDLPAKRALIEGIRKSFAREFRLDEHFIGRLGDRFRKDRKDLAALLIATREGEHPLWPGVEVLQRRARRFAPIMAELKDLSRAGKLSTPLQGLAASHLHMHANRLLRSAQRTQETVLYDYLSRLYESRLACENAKANAAVLAVA